MHSRVASKTDTFYSELGLEFPDALILIGFARAEVVRLFPGFS
jgi:hypothetical protein